MQKLKAERCFCALGLYLGPPFCRAWLFTTPVFDHPSVGGEFWWGALLPWESLATPW
jgi:hypothetical protein